VKIGKEIFCSNWGGAGARKSFSPPPPPSRSRRYSPEDFLAHFRLAITVFPNLTRWKEIRCLLPYEDVWGVWMQIGVYLHVFLI